MDWMTDPSLTDKERSRAMQEEDAALKAELVRLDVRSKVSTDLEELRAIIERCEEIEVRQREIRAFAAAELERLTRMVAPKGSA